MNKNICVYCSSSNNVDKKFFYVAQELGVKIVKNGYGLVYGGTDIGLMGEVAKSACSINGKVIGVIPQKIKDHGLANECITELIVTENMRQRKELMEKHSDVFIAMPGGFGTLEEIIEMIVAKQLGYHQKPLIFLNTDGFYNPLYQMFEQYYNYNFAKSVYRDLFYSANNVDDVFSYLANYEEKEVVLKW